MPPNQGLVHLKEYDIKDSNVELIGTDLDHKVKYNSAATEPAWKVASIGTAACLCIWRIEAFEVVPWPTAKYGQFHEGDSYIILQSVKVASKDGRQEHLSHDIFFWLGAHTSQDEAGTAAYKTVELDEFLHGAAVQHREVQTAMSDEFIALFPRITILRGGVASGFTHVEAKAPSDITTLLRIFKHPCAPRRDSVLVVEVEASWQSLDAGDVFVLDKGEKIWVWQGKGCSPMEKAKAAQVVHDMTLAKRVDIEVLGQNEARSRLIVDLLGGQGQSIGELTAERPLANAHREKEANLQANTDREKKLFRVSDASGSIRVDLVKQGDGIKSGDFDGNDVYLFDTGKVIWVWEGKQASISEKASWIKVAQWYVRELQNSEQRRAAHLIPVAKVTQGNETPALLKSLA